MGWVLEREWEVVRGLNGEPYMWYTLIYGYPDKGAVIVKLSENEYEVRRVTGKVDRPVATFTTLKSAKAYVNRGFSHKIKFGGYQL